MKAAKGGKVSTSTEGLADIFGESADIGAATAMDADGEIWVVVMQDLDGIDFYLAGRDVESFTLAG